MDAKEFGQLCIECAEALAPSYGDGLVACVRSEIWGGDRSGSPRHMGFGLDVGQITGIASLLVSMLSVAISAAEFRRKRPDATETGESRPDIAAVEQALDRELADLGREQRAVGSRLKMDICAWLRTRADG